MAYDQSFKATELRLGLPGTHEHDDDDHDTNKAINKKRKFSSSSSSSSSSSELVNRDQKVNKSDDHVQEEQEKPPPPKAQIVGWPPVRGYRKNSLMMSQQKKISSDDNDHINVNVSNEVEISGMFVKVSMDGAPYLRKIDIRVYNNYTQLLKALESMFNFTLGEYSEREGYKGSDFLPTYEDKDGDWMLVGDVPWNMFMSSCKRMRIMKESEARGLGCGA